ncbi:Putative alkaline-shock protein [Candidatus Hydrogenisulfobacillus filiaventi]|uniref:Alkaline-shock protein n=1 Tax=Candidatus Hydrogenisulfobacillus filiaventi TaxID=2707344 RepID=A0A6F8ZHP5_9FIRM|nr:Asp23/Gls24 family envelope stress response protein [Bacillota bacterium]CAB1129172.1 Putative alkaline-shock protein [Candidatus Hydrogenisulfobacillus filiaventi]
MERETPWGRLTVGEDVIATLAGLATVESYGVVGMIPRGVSEGLQELLRRENLARGVQVREEDGRLEVDVYVVVGYGVRIAEVGRAIVEHIGFRLQDAVGVRPQRITVHVQGVR